MGQQGEGVPGRRAGEVGVDPPPARGDVFGQPRVHARPGKILAVLVKLVEDLPPFVHKAAPVQGIGIHHRHVGEHGPVLFVAIGKAKAAPQVVAHRAEIGVEPDAPNRGIVEIMFHGADHLDRLILGGNSAHQRENLAGERHANRTIEIALHPLPVVIVIAIEPGIPAGALDPFAAAQVFGQGFGLGL